MHLILPTIIQKLRKKQKEQDNILYSLMCKLQVIHLTVIKARETVQCPQTSMNNYSSDTTNAAFRLDTRKGQEN